METGVALLELRIQINKQVKRCIFKIYLLNPRIKVKKF